MRSNPWLCGSAVYRRLARAQSFGGLHQVALAGGAGCAFDLVCATKSEIRVRAAAKRCLRSLHFRIDSLPLLSLLPKAFPE